ncbi:P-loop containing nucleoside triphosphate hydrolase protein [Choiromyces venosus 120613-1]|uniref:P-loop containing nucleoside triphosphate hydrolase protein n=1 Tax=Choiromyces venosus 120613-1 TaxID=1336337 RepID=A0A3N4JBT2_9PEZI|nr:P-loop containing nucleoside triphosphate hydrolase protein [Choiromyces venosus 120613-1]
MKVSLKRTDQPGETTDRGADHVLCETRHFNAQGDFTHRSLNINSPHLKDALHGIIGDYPGISFRTENVHLRAPYRCLFHYLDELRRELEEQKIRRKNESIEHLEFLVGFIEEEFEEVRFEAGNYLPEGLVSYESLWTIFKPGTIMFQSSFGHQHALSLVRADYYHKPVEQVILTLAYVDYNGKEFGLANSKVTLHTFEGLERISELPAYPLIYHPRHNVVRRTLMTRGRRFESFVGRHYAEYKDIGLGEMVNGLRKQYHINGRVIIDADTYSRFNPSRFGPLKPLASLTPTNSAPASSINSRTSPGRSRAPGDNPPDYSDYTSDYSDYEDDRPAADKPSEKPPLQAPSHRGGLTDAQCLITHYLLPGFSMCKKSWVEVFIDTLAPIHWNHAALDTLAIPMQKKALMTTLVEAHIKSAANITGYDDVIVGKGRGHVFVLRGPPGVGKTLTVEAIAEQTRRPLYTLSAGELGSTPHELTISLPPILELATAWKAILLLEEADVFLEARAPGEVHRNMLFSTFMKFLDGYKGIIFMTTNRVAVIDDAIKSRAHVMLNYSELGFHERRGVWESMLMREGNGSFALLENRTLDELAMRERVDGRMIRNVVVGARGLGERRGKTDGAGQEEIAAMLESMGVHPVQMAAARSGKGREKWRGVSVVSGKDGMQVVDDEIWTPLWFDKITKPALEKDVGAEFSRFERSV